MKTYPQADWQHYKRSWPVNVGRQGWRGLLDHFIALMRGRSYSQVRGNMVLSFYWKGHKEAFIDDIRCEFEVRP